MKALKSKEKLHYRVPQEGNRPSSRSIVTACATMPFPCLSARPDEKYRTAA
jgi:hypothetical protein